LRRFDVLGRCLFPADLSGRLIALPRSSGRGIVPA
jgi:hypothetical protein